MVLPNRLMTIGEFSRQSQVSIRALRHYDDLNLLTPAHIDQTTGYRYYLINNLPRLYRIRSLMDLGMSLKEISFSLARSESNGHSKKVLSAKKHQIDEKIKAFQLKQDRLSAQISRLESEESLPMPDVILKNVASQAVVSIRASMQLEDSVAGARRRYFSLLYDVAAQHGITTDKPEIVVYHVDQSKHQLVELEFANAVPVTLLNTVLSLAPTYTVQICRLVGAPFVASMIFEGTLSNTANAIAGLLSWVVKNGYEASGPTRELHLWGREGDDIPNHGVIVELQVPLTKQI